MYYFAGIGRFEGKELQAEKLTVYHKGNNTLYVNPVAEIKGSIFANGDVISYHKPPVVAVEARFTGQLYFAGETKGK